MLIRSGIFKRVFKSGICRKIWPYSIYFPSPFSDIFWSYTVYKRNRDLKKCNIYDHLHARMYPDFPTAFNHHGRSFINYVNMEGGGREDVGQISILLI